MARAAHCVLLTLFAIGSAMAIIAAPAMARPIPPCAPHDAAVTPSYGAPSEPPVVQLWRDIEDDGRYACLGLLRGRMALVVALAGRFEASKSLDHIASRIGAISASKGLVYWSTTEQRWRTLISDAFAIEDPATRRPRSDFTAQEVLSGRTLYFGQNDTRSTGQNVYALTAKSVSPDRLVIDIVNLTAIRFAFVRLFEPRALHSVHIFDRMAADAWGYYGLSAVRAGRVNGNEKSIINRADAFYRYLIGEPATSRPPMAP